ncbi:Extracellular serine protease precursor [Poriferisphaera corsica]|uniref:Extracellular serine protease n=1 Tax=Poriferisphaera corsica TaxID=2528020 RepID=A0A517YW23_9BACT|nr:autotransporter outer membrane beta-barrel domain-containing protein [Poriferisphaera corsica]QDU34420.1 Extracellular serine protease precursor [Poriferisphaera corsica]
MSMKKQINYLRTPLRAIARPSTALLLTAFIAGPSFAADYTWYGGAKDDDGNDLVNWDEAGNWNTVAAPAGDIAGGTITFATDLNNQYRVTEVKQIENVGSVQFTSSQGFNILPGESWLFQAGGKIESYSASAVHQIRTSIVATAGGLNILNYNPTVGRSTSEIQLSGGLRFDGDVVVGDIAGTASGDVRISGLYQSSNPTSQIVKYGSGTLYMEGTSLFAGGVELHDGILAIGRSDAISSGTPTRSTLTIEGGGLRAYSNIEEFNSVQYNPFLALQGITNDLDVNSDFFVTGGNVLAVTGDTDFGGVQRTIDLQNNATTNLLGEFVGLDAKYRSGLILNGDFSNTNNGMVIDTTTFVTVNDEGTNRIMKNGGSLVLFGSTPGKGNFIGDVTVNAGELGMAGFAKVTGDVNVTTYAENQAYFGASFKDSNRDELHMLSTIRTGGVVDGALTLNGGRLFIAGSSISSVADMKVTGKLTLTNHSLMHVLVSADVNGNAYTGAIEATGDVQIDNDTEVVVQYSDVNLIRNGQKYKVLDTINTNTINVNFDPAKVHVDDLPDEFNFQFVEETAGTSTDYFVEMSVKPYDQIAKTDNEMAVAKVLQEIRVDPTLTGDMKVVIDAFNNQATGEFRPALLTISPEESADKMVTMGFHGVKAQNNNVNSRLNDLRYNKNLWSSHTQNYFSAIMEKATPEEAYDLALQTSSYFEDQAVIAQDTFDPDLMNRVGFFVTGYGTFGDVGNNKDQVGYDWETYGATVGMDYRLSDELIVGAYGGYSYSEAKVLRGGGSSTVNSMNGGIYGAYQSGGSYVSGSAGLGYNVYDNNRVIQFGSSLDRVAKSDPTGYQFTAAATIGHDFTVREWTFGPYAQVEFANLNVEEYTEEGAGALNLDLNELDLKSLLGRIGMHAGVNIDWDRVTFMPEVHAAYQHQFYDTSESMTARFAGATGGSFEFNTRELTENAFIGGFGITAYNRESGDSLYLFYDGEFGENEYSIHTFRGGMRFTF